jgi:hypothetical protein
MRRPIKTERRGKGGRRGKKRREKKIKNKITN